MRYLPCFCHILDPSRLCFSPPLLSADNLQEPLDATPRELRTMAANCSRILDCRIEVRDYRLVLNPTRWMQNGERVMVQSPMFEILESTSHVSAKRYSFGEEQNSVCFLPRNDIDSYYTGTRRWVDAHGIAGSNSSPTDPLHFERGHRF